MRLALALVLVTSLAAQDPKFGVQSRLVLVPVTVLDAKGRSVEGLELSDFLVYDNGVPRRPSVDTFATGVAPIALVVAVQSSGISIAVLEKVQKIGSMIQPLITGERGCAALLSFDDRLRWRQECTRDPDALAKAFAALTPGEHKTARMLDAAHEAIASLRKRANVRRVLLLISESRDRGSESELAAVIMDAQAAGVTVYVATYSAVKTAFTTRTSNPEPATEPVTPRPNRTGTITPQGRAPLPGPDGRADILGGLGELARLAKVKDADALSSQTGGVTFPFTRQKGLENAIEKLGAELHSQYLLSFSPENATPGFHQLEIRINRPGKFRVRARPGYWSSM
ncbi:MAG TPA: VWA domain-containing protein [Bryobacteraceae bacterium]|nr:VWA domain-containing protein [Bryobacteraceae bacterium]